MRDFDLAKKLALQRMQQYAQQSDFQAPQGQMVSGHYVAPHALQYLASGLRSFGGVRGQQLAQEELKSLSEQERQATANALRQFGTLSQGAPENAPGDGMGPVQPARRPDMRQAYSALLNAPSQQLQQMGLQGLAQIPEMEARAEERNLDREMRAQAQQAQIQARAQELQLAHQQRMEALQAQNASREQMAREQREFQREMVKITAALRPERPQPQAQIIQTESGPMILPPGTNQAVPVVGPGGAQVRPAASATGAPKPLTESQAKGALYLGQMRSATAELEQLPKVSPVATAAAGNTMTNWATSGDAQKVAQAQNQWAEAYLRAKTGAAATQGEVDLNRRTFFPVVGDSPAVIEQKRKMRQQAERDMEPSAGPAAAGAGGVQSAPRKRIRFDAQGNIIQ